MSPPSRAGGRLQYDIKVNLAKPVELHHEWGSTPDGERIGPTPATPSCLNL